MSGVCDSMAPRRYRVYAKKWNWQATLGEGYSLAQAQAIAAVLCATCMAARPREDSWTHPFFGYEPVEPAIPEARAVGDIAFYRVDSHFRYAQDGTVVSFARYFRAGLVAAIRANGNILAVQTFDGERIEAPTVSCSFDQGALDMKTALADLHGRHARYLEEGFTGLPWGCCHSVSDARHLVRPFALDQGGLATPIATALAQEIIESHGLPPGHLPAAVDTGALQAALDAALAAPQPIRLAA